MAVNKNNDMKEKIQESILNEGVVQNKLPAGTPAMAALDESELDRVAGGFTTAQTSEGKYVNLADHTGTYSTEEAAGQAINALSDANNYSDWYNSSLSGMKTVGLSDGKFGITYSGNGVYDKQEDAEAEAHALEYRTGRH